ncbi:SHOCT domain-containing protein [Streptomyces sp. SP17BM10]|uniref:SHOCT domain-containing protein n=1 Tax=Streptomyces sp. SP17BM10 TaxID=3002530 RepID=UPI002E792F7B|nr:SHOCT domain-containing protein [Streptomyces sp. SP17BM10]MEE1788323.1 SHOCT domain-containing protein [Streptomyces sp. SP17BM10]
MRHWHGYVHHGLSGWGIGLMVLVMLLVLALLVLAAVALSRYVSRSHRPLPQGAATGGPPRTGMAGPTPEQLLAERFARGEIDADEYRLRLDTLRSANGPGSGPGPGAAPGG